MMTTRSETSSASSWSCVTKHARHVHLLVQPPQPAAQLLPHLRVQRPERLVEQQHLRLDREGPGERDALALPAGELGGPALGQHVELHEAAAGS